MEMRKEKSADFNQIADFFLFLYKGRYSEELTHWQQDRLPPEPMRTYINGDEKSKIS
jgi:hypothetical protein